MKKQKHPTPSNPASTIKGYLPIRIALPPPIPGAPPFTTFIYVKEHISKHTSNDAGDASSSTLFVANAPANGPIRTNLFLQAFFRRYGHVVRVTVAQNPRKAATPSDSSYRSEASDAFRNVALLSSEEAISKDERGDGKFAHVVFASGKERTRAWKAIREDIAGSDDGILRLDPQVTDSLIETTRRLRQKSQNDDDENDDDDDAHDEEATIARTGIQAIVQRYKLSACRHIPRQKLMELCNDAMSAYEHTEAEAERRAKRLAEQPDEDGFITVTHGSATPSFGVANDLEQQQHETGKRGKGSKRNRKRKADNRSGAGTFSDFYKFQWKESKKKEMQDLKARFEQDLEKVKKMKEERAFRPF
ncbi:hypothetical protein ACHAW6_015288 [Cyclotella cf. meneghiniana]